MLFHSTGILHWVFSRCGLMYPKDKWVRQTLKADVYHRCARSVCSAVRCFYRACIFIHRKVECLSVIGLKRVLGYSDSGRCQTSTRYWRPTRVLGIYNDRRNLCFKVACGDYLKAYRTSAVITVTM